MTRGNKAVNYQNNNWFLLKTKYLSLKRDQLRPSKNVLRIYKHYPCHDLYSTNHTSSQKTISSYLFDLSFPFVEEKFKCDYILYIFIYSFSFCKSIIFNLIEQMDLHFTIKYSSETKICISSQQKYISLFRKQKRIRSNLQCKIQD